MKRVFFDTNEINSKGKPFWYPWGFGGWLWRSLVFLAIILFVFMILAMIHRRSPIDTRPPLPSEDSIYIPPIDSTEIAIDPEDSISYIIPNQLLVIFDGDATRDTFEQWAKEFKMYYPGSQYYIVHYRVLTQTMLLIVPEEERDRIAQRLPKQITDISFYVAKVDLLNADHTPNDEVFATTLNWWYAPIQAYEAWDITRGNSDIVIGIIDSYFDLSHEELKGDRIINPFNVITNSSDVYPPSNIDSTTWGHGSFVASVAAGNMNNKAGIAGIAPKCKIMPVSLGKCLTSYSEIEAMMYCIKMGADVINASIGAVLRGCASKFSIEEQIEYSHICRKYGNAVWDYVFDLANQKNVTIVWSAGNDTVFTAMDCSKRNRTTIKVSAVDHKLQRALFSNFGNFEQLGEYQSTISAPGEYITGAVPDNQYEVWGGTSFSAPIVSGAVALMKSIDSTLTNEEIIDILKRTGKPIPDAPEIGKLIQIKDALLSVQNRYANFCDIKENPDLLLGWWKTTEQLGVTVNGKPTNNKVLVFYHFEKNGKGSVLYKETTGYDYTGNMSWHISDNKIYIEVSRAASSSNPTFHYLPVHVEGEADENCQLICKDKNVEEYMLIKLDQQP